ncbi:MAG: Asp-tRNA(Asn)/Glu-tRNA(Gln) amidotransferase subunit GatA [Phaeodactylibacter sp.]|nr:Asp-tRNA(Asn)/Glu-tRNA(Gln) amidotransferase subunit GatA [Phaeodactylibacter sp.]
MPKYTTLTQALQAIRSGSESCESLVRYYLGRIEASRALNAYVEVYADEALQRARELDARYRENPRSAGRLHGMVLSHKDVICYEGHGVTAGSKILEGFTSLYSATAVERLLAEGAIFIGRTNCDEFAMGSSNENSHYGPVKNAADPTKVPGGSSGGSAVAVQADTCLASLGSDTGGSVRQPAAFCGVVGFKPTYGRISRYGLLAYGSSFDQIGILSHSVEDAALLLEVMAGPDEYDSTASQREVPAYSRQLGFEGKARVAYFNTALEHPSLDPGIRQACDDLIGRLRQAGHTVEGVGFEYLDYIIPAYYVLTTAEASSNLSRYDGIRYGYRSANAHNLMSTYKRSRTEGFGTEVKRRIMLGTFVLSAGYYDAYYSKAQKVRRLIRDKTNAIFADYDFILMPAAPGPAWNLGEKMDDPVAMYLADIFTVQANMVGIPAIALPVGAHPGGLPVGLQFMAPKFEEGKLLGFSRYLMEEVLKA